MAPREGLGAEEPARESGGRENANNAQRARTTRPASRRINWGVHVLSPSQAREEGQVDEFLLRLKLPPEETRPTKTPAPLSAPPLAVSPPTSLPSFPSVPFPAATISKIL